MSEDIEIRERLVRIETLLERLAHDLKNYKTALEAYVPRRELDERFASIHDRLANIESDKVWLQRQVWGAWIAGTITVGSLLLKKL